MSLYQFFGTEKKVNHQRMEKLLGLLQEHTRPVRPELLGVIGEEHLRQMLVNAGGEPKSFKYIASAGIADGVPYMVEIAFCPFKQWVDGGTEPGSGADHRRQFQRHPGKPVQHIQGHGRAGRNPDRAARRRIRAGHRLRALRLPAHRISGSRQEPHRLGVKIMGAADDIKKGLTEGLKTFTKQRKAEEKQSSAGRWRRSRMIEARGEFLTEASDAIMEEAYMKASDNNTLPATARQVFYVARPLLQDRTEKPLIYSYFSQTLLPDYIKNHKQATADWDVVYDDRGHFMEPHTGRVIGLGTLPVRRLSQSRHTDELRGGF